MSRSIKFPKELEDKIHHDLLSIPKILKSRRIELGFTQEEVSNRLDCEITTIQAIEQGRRVPSIQTLLCLSKVLKLKFKLE